jgi:hypothetical protein
MEFNQIKKFVLMGVAKQLIPVLEQSLSLLYVEDDLIFISNT